MLYRSIWHYTTKSKQNKNLEKIGIPNYVVNMFNQKEYLTEINDIKNIIKKRNKYSQTIFTMTIDLFGKIV